MTRSGERGSVTAELVVALPAVALVLALCLAGMNLGMAAMAVQDAAAAAARSLARGEPESAAAARAAAAAPGSVIAGISRGELVCVTVTRRGVPALPMSVSGTACSLAGGA